MIHLFQVYGNLYSSFDNHQGYELFFEPEFCQMMMDMDEKHVLHHSHPNNEDRI
ncbi:hypothetical protein ACQKP8_27010 [Photobacterium alginatilyticum]|uniref:hypothetical protein n=1 Tax=Photobacterium alginatilyticum TaxID=1775171 RepID=UPI00406823DF